MAGGLKKPDLFCRLFLKFPPKKYSHAHCPTNVMETTEPMVEIRTI